ncbi:MAG TPA: hypothetical protein VGO09_01515, partial [Flavisolibacter sp.]|nr:hypothetical protein [Flavisolibacter sp.]
FFGELASDKNFHFAFIQGILFSADPKISASVLYRNIPKEYQSIFGNANTSTSFPSNEKGVNIGIAVKPIPELEINASADMFYFPWLKYRVDAPGRGSNYYVALHFLQGKTYNFYLSYRNKSGPVNFPIGASALNYVFNEINKTLQFQFTDHLSSKMTLANRFEIMWLKNNESGFLSYIDCSNHHSKKFESSVRVQYFETINNISFYTYENSALNFFNTPSSGNKGIRYYMTLNYRIKEKITLFLNWSQTIYSNKTEIGYGSELIKGNKHSALNFQVKFEW